MDLVDESTTCCYSPKLPENTYQRVQPSLETLVEFLHAFTASEPYLGLRYIEETEISRLFEDVVMKGMSDHVNSSIVYSALSIGCLISMRRSGVSQEAESHMRCLYSNAMVHIEKLHMCPSRALSFKPAILTELYRQLLHFWSFHTSNVFGEMTDPAKKSIAPYSVVGKTAIITGAGSGINFSFAELLLERGCNVVIADLALRPEAEQLVSSYQDKSNARPRAVFVKTDVTSWPALSNMFKVAIEEFGSFDIFCPGAGVYEPHWSNFWHPPGSSESKDSVEGGKYALLDINITHPIRSTQLAISYWLHPKEATNAALPPSIKASPENPKRIVHISSVAGQVANINAPLYAASKFAITGFVRSLARLEGTNGIRVNAVAPGVVQTPLWTEHPEKLVNLDEAQDGWVTPREVAEAMLRCVEEEALVGGSILEVGKDNTRLVEAFNAPGPDPDPKRGLVARNGSKGTDMVFSWLRDAAKWAVGRD
ncbi:short chain dehydrogenase [Colletotrichum scovillei]|uniref:short chain dehydrogenase n=1 Tax=Colletotrichum scovillei TaxID=1209932 RepID=UPI0015C343EA|nr:short chain dehydrogenase [Colletotrichum scovillei]KAF4775896.1 short chain dehydrogenase [Colletotrichum scovillei]